MQQGEDLVALALGMLFIVFFFGLLATAGYFFGRSRGLGWAGALIGLVGPLGLIIIAAMPKWVPCPACEKLIHPDTRECPHCGKGAGGKEPGG